MTIDPDGDAYVTDSLSPVIYKFTHDGGTSVINQAFSSPTATLGPETGWRTTRTGTCRRDGGEAIPRPAGGAADRERAPPDR